VDGIKTSNKAEEAMITEVNTSALRSSAHIRLALKNILRGRLIYRLNSVYTCWCIVGLLVLNGCNPCFYTPNAQNVPLFQEGKEGMVNFSLQGGFYSRGLNIQTAFSATDHLGFLLNYHYYGASYNEGDAFIFSGEDGHFHGNFGEAAIGYFFNFDTKWIFEAYGGMGLGKVVNENDVNYYTWHMPYYRATVKYLRYFVQPAVGWVANEHFELAISSRFCLMNYTDLELKAGDNQNIYQVTDINNNPFFLLEPAFTMRVGGKNVKFQYQVTYSEDFNNSEHFDPLGTSFAVFFRIQGKQE
jgi:hypothetical protein